ncbi:hypothetical protein KBD69_01165 [Candidatus Woesebacteria bacterium]|nr:hypothetical protein [Candidatus Woesebacteria bacterium]
MRKNDAELETAEPEEVSEKEEKKAKRKEGADKRRNQKKKDKIARWSGFILLLVVIMVGFLMWIAGEINTGY